MKKFIQLLLLIAILSLTGCQKENYSQLNIYSLSGPTSMGLAKLYSDDQNELYIRNIVSDGSQIAAALANEQADIAMMPANLASVLYNKTHDFKVVAINTLGVLYLIENGNNINSLQDLKGKTIVLTGQSTTPEYALRYLLKCANIENDVELQFKSSASEVASTLVSGLADIALLPQPFATVALEKDSNLRISLDLNDLWSQYTNGQQLITAVTVVRNEILENNPTDVQHFLSTYQESINWVNDNPENAANMIVDLGIVNDSTIAQKAIPFCNLVYIDGEEMKTLLENYLNILYQANPESIGKNLPDENFYFIENN